MSELERRLEGLSPAKQALLREWTQCREQERQQSRTIPRRTNRDELPISFAQERIWLHEQLNPGSVVYNRPANLRLHGPLQIEPLRQALDAVVARHESLRTTVRCVGYKPTLCIHSHMPVEMPFTDLSSEPEPERRSRQMAREEAGRSFDLAQGPLLRSHLLRIDNENHLLLLTFHHISFDAWSQAVLLEELTRNYETCTSGEKPLVEATAIQYPDFAAWDRSSQRVAALETGRSYWRRELTNPPVLQLPTDFPRPARPSELAGHVELQLPAELVVRLRELASCEQTTLFSVLLAAFTTLLYRYTGDNDIVVGCPVAGRNRVETEPLIGVFINTLPFRSNIVTADTFRQLLRRVRESVIGGLPHQDVPLQLVVQDVLSTRDTSDSPLFQTMFIHERIPLKPHATASEIFEPEDSGSAATMLDLALEMMESHQEVGGRFVYRCELWERSTIERMVGHFLMLLKGILADADQKVSELSLLTKPERHQLLVQWNNTAVEYPDDKCVHELFEQQAQRTPDAVAVVFEDQEMTYRELNERANQLAHHLSSRGVGPETLVGLCLQRSPELVVGVLGILKAGGAYVPLDPMYPAERLSFMQQDSQASVIVTHSRFVEKLLEHHIRVICLDKNEEAISAENNENLTIKIASDEPLYVIYTSGSTGTPKGVVGIHRAAVNRFTWMWRNYPFGPDDVCCLKTTISFADSVWEIFGPLLCGIRTVVFSDEIVKDPIKLVHALAVHRVTRIVLVPSLLRVLLETYSDLNRRLPELKIYVTSGEALAGELVQRFRKGVPDARLINLYGSSEVAADVTCCDTTQEQSLTSIPIGCPIANTQAYVLDAQRHPVPIGVSGELYIGGAGLARGYLNRLELTAEKFVAHPFDDDPDARLYRTGDLCRWRADGYLEFLGRLDDQVKLRGFRIELGEIETVLNEHPNVVQAVVVLREDRPGDKRLVAYCVAAAETIVSSAELRTYLLNRLPDYMLPAAFLQLETLQLSSSGKINRLALPAPDDSRPELETFYVAPRNLIEQQLASIWCEVLGIENIGIHDNFFALGGHSLLATRVNARIVSSLQVDLPLRKLFDAPTIAELSTEIETQQNGGLSFRGSALKRVDREQLDRLPLSFAQQRLWFLEQMEGELTAYNIPFAWRLRGILHTEVLRRALEAIVRRHEPLRTTYAMIDEEPVQVIGTIQRFELPLEDLRGFSTDQQAEQIAKRCGEEAIRPFDLTSDLMLRASLLRLSEDEHVLLLTMHHIASDGWSLRALWRELDHLYDANIRGADPDLPDLLVQYADYAVWQRQELQGRRLEHLLQYWRKQLDGVRALELPTDRPRPPMPTYYGSRYDFELKAEIVDQLKALCQAEGVTLYMMMLAAFQTLLSRYSNQDDIAVGTPIAARNHAELEDQIGLFVNTLVLRTKLSKDPTFRELLSRVRQVSLSAYDHQDLPFEKLVEELQPERHLNRSPLFQVLFQLLSFPNMDLALSDLEVARVPSTSQRVRFDLEMHLWQQPKILRGAVVYSTDLFDHSTMELMVGHFLTLLQGIVADANQRISELPLLTEPERQQLLVQWNDTAVDYATAAGDASYWGVHELFTAQVRVTPSAVAVSCRGESLSYAELDARSNRLAHYLGSHGIGRELLVGIYLERSLDMLVALLGVLKAGAAYVPLDPSFPVERLEFMLTDAQVSLLLSESRLRSALPATEAPVVYLDQEWDNIAGHRAEAIAEAISPEQLAYVIYTSGSTGKPKGVQIPHQALTNFLLSMADEPGLGSDDVLLAVTTLSFDIAGLELYLPLLVGAQVVIASREEAADAQRLAQSIAESKVTVMQATPATWRLLFESGWSGQPGLKVLCGGESLPRDLAEQILAADMELWNLYGPTETTIWSAVARVESGSDPVPIGRPIANTQIYVLDDWLGLLPVGVTGELYIGGAGLARGYLNRAELTAKRFIDSPFRAGERLYRTGDLARYRADGRLELLGRIDTQVKVRGYRIELGEIETVLSGHGCVQEAVVVVREDAAGDKRIVAYVIPTGESVESGELRSHLLRSLPDYMVPTTYVMLESYPLTPNGKIDRQALPVPEPSQSVTGNGYVAPRTKTEQVLAGIWSEVLGVESVGIEDDFFDLGGHSLLAVRLVASMEAALDRKVQLASIFQNRTIAALSGTLEQDSGTNQSRTCVELRRSGTKSPLFAGGSHPRYLDVAGSTDKDRPFYRLDVYALQSERIARGLKPLTNIEDMAEHFIGQIRIVQPQGPYYLGGGCEGGYVAFEMARQLQQQEEEVARLIVWLVPAPDAWQSPALRYAAFRVFGEVWGMIRRGALRQFDRQSLKVLMQHEFIEYKIYKAIEKYKPTTPYRGSMILARHFDPKFPHLAEESMGWKDWVTDSVEVHELPGQHKGWLEEYWEPFSQLLDDCLARRDKAEQD